MHSKSTRRGTLVAAAAFAALCAPQLTVGAQAATAPRAGLVGRPMLLQDHTQFNGYDVATDAAGNMYIGWISGDSSTTGATRKVRFCTLRPGRRLLRRRHPGHRRTRNRLCRSGRSA